MLTGKIRLDESVQTRLLTEDEDKRGNGSGRGSISLGSLPSPSLWPHHTEEIRTGGGRGSSRMGGLCLMPLLHDGALPCGLLLPPPLCVISVFPIRKKESELFLSYCIVPFPPREVVPKTLFQG